ncbi:MAG: FKBP-type peptidyl-prolyl cis-trans isomerase [Flavobacteriales bacterium]|jgi:hypothetical protein|nr:FKBP-type peptidyl-prolyl cis-trans isomerase [Flavobacteriales bacterium]
MLKILPLLFLSFLWLSSCEENKKMAPVQGIQPTEDLIEQELIKKNIRRTQYEQNAIDTLMRINHWEYQKTATGLRIQLGEEDCEGKKKPKVDDYLLVEMEIRDIFNKPIYPKETTRVIFHKDYHVNGVTEALGQMCEGSSAKLIVPSHLGHGTRGDENRIKPNQVLLYSIKLKKIN